MSYTHVCSDSGIVHAKSSHSDYLVCGKPYSFFWLDVSDPVTCKVCIRSIEVSRDYRVARELTVLVRELYDDMINRPGAYLDTTLFTIQKMKQIVEGE